MYVLYSTLEMINYILIYIFIFGVSMTQSRVRYVMFCVFLTAPIVALYDVISVEIVDIYLTIYGIAIPIFLTKEYKLKNIILYISVYIISGMISFAVMEFTSILRNVNQLGLISSPKYAVAFNGASTFAIALYGTLFSNKGKKPFASLTAKQCILLDIALLCCFCLVSSIQAFSEPDRVPTEILNVYSFSAILFSFAFFIVIMLLSRSIQERNRHRHEEEVAKLRMQEQEERFNLISRSDTRIRHFRHDIRNHLSVLNQYLKEQKYDDAIEYLDTLGTVFNESTCISYTGIVAVDAIINHYRHEMDELGITFNWSSDIISTTDTDIFDICTIFDNLLSNAVEACSGYKGTSPSVSLSANVRNGHWLVIESNPLYSDVSFDRHGNPLTTKPDTANHGFGCRNIREVVDKYGGSLEYLTEQGQFEIRIAL